MYCILYSLQNGILSQPPWASSKINALIFTKWPQLWLIYLLAWGPTQLGKGWLLSHELLLDSEQHLVPVGRLDVLALPNCFKVRFGVPVHDLALVCVEVSATQACMRGIESIQIQLLIVRDLNIHFGLKFQVLVGVRRRDGWVVVLNHKGMSIRVCYT